MKTLNTLGTALLALAVAGTGFAQQGQRGARDGSGPMIDTSQVVVVDGVVVAFVAGLGQGLPALEVQAADGTVTSFLLGPYWYLTQEGFVAAAGDLVTVTAYPCSLCETGLVVASVVNHTQGVTLVLRDAEGLPLWVKHSASNGPAAGGSGGMGSGNGGMGGGQGGMHGGGTVRAIGGGMLDGDMLRPDLTQTATYSGAVVTFTAAAGTGAGTLVLATVDGDVSFVLSPIWALLRAEFEPAVGTSLDVVAAPATVDGVTYLVALTIADPSTGITIVLRDPSTGLPISGSGWHGGF